MFLKIFYNCFVKVLSIAHWLHHDISNVIQQNNFTERNKQNDGKMG